MSPQLFARQLDDGAWAITVATVQQMHVAIAYGCRRIVIANQLIGRIAPRAAFQALRQQPDLELYCLVDSGAGVAVLADAAQEISAPQPLRCLVEGGVAGGRTGCRTVADALAVGRAVKAAEPRLTLAGVEGFEGIIATPNPEGTVSAVNAFLDFLTNIARALEAERLYADGELILSAGGSMFYDLAVERLAVARLQRKFRVVTRSGCYLTHDSGQYGDALEHLRLRDPSVSELGPGLTPALMVWAYVQSRPEPRKAIASMGKRDVSYDVSFPRPVLRFRPRSDQMPVPVTDIKMVALNDQHCHLELPVESPLAVGDMLCFGISHPCTTFDKWQVIPIVDDDWNVVGAVRTFF
jgi:D-serine dehydratase